MKKVDETYRNPDVDKMMKHGQAIADAIGLETTDETFNPVIVVFYEKIGYDYHTPFWEGIGHWRQTA